MRRWGLRWGWWWVGSGAVRAVRGGGGDKSEGGRRPWIFLLTRRPDNSTECPGGLGPGNARMDLVPRLRRPTTRCTGAPVDAVAQSPSSLRPPQPPPVASPQPQSGESPRDVTRARGSDATGQRAEPTPSLQCSRSNGAPSTSIAHVHVHIRCSRTGAELGRAVPSDTLARRLSSGRAIAKRRCSMQWCTVRTGDGAAEGPCTGQHAGPNTL